MEIENLVAGKGKIFRDAWRAGYVGAGAAINSALLTERDRWPLWIPVLFGIGVSIYFTLPIEPPYWLGLLSIIVAASCLWVQREEPRGFLIAVGLAMVAAGLVAAQARTYSVTAPILEHAVRSVHVSGRVRNIENRAQGIRILLEDLTLTGPAVTERPMNTLPKRIRITVHGSSGLRPGDVISTRASLRPPPRPAAPNAFDFGRMAFFRGLGAVGYATGRIQVVSSGSEGFIDQIANWIATLRLQVSDRVLKTIPDERGTVAVALLIGDRGAIPERILVAMRDSGLAHLLAISGLHVGLFAGLLLAVSRNLLALAVPLALRYPVKKWAAVFSLAGAFGYLLMTGGTIPTQRAFLMITLGLLAIVFDRIPISMTIVAWAAIGLLLTSPESLLSAGFSNVLRGSRGADLNVRGAGFNNPPISFACGCMASRCPVPGGGSVDHVDCKPCHGAVRGISFQSNRSLRSCCQPGRCAHHGTLDHALGARDVPSLPHRMVRVGTHANDLGDWYHPGGRPNRGILARCRTPCARHACLISRCDGTQRSLAVHLDD